MGRVHVISRPLTGYLRYEFAVYRRTVAAGVHLHCRLHINDELRQLTASWL
ncbi:MAG: DUF6879 family protein [Pseudonocardiaceae bacterium]